MPQTHTDGWVDVKAVFKDCLLAAVKNPLGSASCNPSNRESINEGIFDLFTQIVIVPWHKQARLAKGDYPACKRFQDLPWITFSSSSCFSGNFG